MTAVAARIRRPALWMVYPALGVLVCLLYAFVPPIAGNGFVVPGVGLSCSVAIILGTRRNKPDAAWAWYLFALGQFMFAMGDAYTYIYPRVFGADVPFPSWGDAIYLSLYPALFGGIFILARRRNPSGEWASLIDSLILTIGLGLISWLVLISPVIHDDSQTQLARIVSIAYPTADILLLAGALRLAVDNGKRQPAFYLLFCSITTLLVTDFIYGVMLNNGTYNGQVLLDIGWISYYLLWGTSALHPSMRTLEEPVPEKETSLSWQRLGVLTVASLIAPGMQVLLGGNDAGVDVLVMIAASIGLFLLVVARMAVLVVQQERSVERERALREAGTALVGAAGRADIGAAALSATRTLAGAGYSARLCLLTGEQLELIGLALTGGTLLSRGTTQRLLLAASIPTATELPEEVYNELLFSERPRSAHVLSLEVRDEARGVLLAAGPGNLSGSQRAALQSLATSVSLALEGAALTEDLHRRESEARFSSLVARSSDLITVVAADGIVLYQSPSIERVLGYAADEVIGTRFDDLMDDHERGRLLAVLSSKNKQPDSGPEAIDCRLRHRDGRWLQFEVLHTNLLDDEHVRGIVLNSRDVSERKAFEEQLAHQAFHDSLTMLANRALFADRVEHALARAGSQGTGIAVVFGDLDDFKTINDSLGHGAGDEVLVEVARRLAATVRPEDTAARFGGDEFAVLLEGIVTDGDATEVADRVLEAFRQPIQLADAEVFVRTSIGIAITRDGAESTPSELLRNADVAMYIAKRDGKGGYRVFEESMHAEALERLELRADLQRAIDSDQFALVYQPVVRLGDMTVSGVEALLRWRHPTRGVIAPAQFIPAAEDMGLIVPIGQWVLREAFVQAVELQRRFPSDPQLTMAVNLSPRQLNQGDIVGDVRRAIRDSGIDPSTVVLEITESLMMTDADLAIKRLEEMKGLGVRLAMDDFGTGYSSLSYLSRFPVDILKMDRSFLEAESDADSGLAAAVVALGESLDMQVVAEGIELTTQMTSLRQLGCELGQGFLFARPMGIESVSNYLDDARGGSSVLRLPPPAQEDDAQDEAQSDAA
jgi:diguanylate cyclase (GGDEF)-like protein/PAS domain S-box-containing protein